ncbi:MAG: hypothetical protein ABJB03_09815 [Rhodoglobus sp.]
MTLTSTEPGALHFRRAFALVVVLLLLFCTGLGVVAFFQGPKLASAQVDTTGVVDQSGQQLRLFANQSVAHVNKSQVTITPPVDFSVTTSGALISVQFDERLWYATDYQVRIAGVTSVYEARPSTLSYRFITETPTVYFLHRGQPDDQIVATGLTGSARSVVYSAQSIQSFVVLPGALAVATVANDGTSRLSIVNRVDGTVSSVPLPASGALEQLQGAESSSLLGFTFTSHSPADGSSDLHPEFTSTLFTFDLRAGGTPQPVLGIDGKPLRVFSWMFVPGTATVVALNRELSLLTVDPATASVLPIGQYSELEHISTDGTRLALTDQRGSIALSLADNSATRLKASPMDGGTPYLGAFQVLRNGDRIEHISLFQDATGRFSTRLVYDDGATSRLLYQTHADTGSIESFSVSPNEQYVAIETIPDLGARVSDGYTVEPRATTITTIIVDVATGKIVRGVEGFDLTW